MTRTFSRRDVLKASSAVALALPLALPAASVLAAAPPATAITPDLIEAAKKEGKIVYYTSIDLSLAEKIAKAFEADMVIFLEIEAFSVASAGDLNVLQGTAKVHVLATEIAHPKNSKGKVLKDQPKEARKAWDETVDTEFPIRGPIPSDSGVSRAAFKNKFLKVCAAEVSWQFVEHAPDDTIQDVKFNGK